MKTRTELKMLAKEAMRLQRKTAILIMLVMTLKALFLVVFNDLFARSLSSFPLFAINLLIVLALIILMVNVMREYLKIYRREHTHVMALYPDFFTHMGHNLSGMMWMVLWGFIWALISIPVIILAIYLVRSGGASMKTLAIILVGPVHLITLIPAIIKSISYSMTPFILSDYPGVHTREALKLSMRMMGGHKKELFKFTLSFFGWFVLSILTLGVLYVVYVGPYYHIALAGFYEEVRAKTVIADDDIIVETETDILQDDDDLVIETAELEAE